MSAGAAAGERPKPSWTPAPRTIGLIWQILYPVILATCGYVFVRAARGRLPPLVALPFAINLVANLIFTPIQFRMRNLPLAAAGRERPSHGRSQRHTPQQGKDQQNDQDQAKQPASRAQNRVSAPVAVATAQQRDEQNHDKDKNDWTHGSPFQQ
jgi:hypothetical protein